MAEVLASLKKIGGNGEQYTETSLWTNPSPTADFATQTITLSDSISNYKYIGIKYCYNKTNTSIIDTVIYKTEEVRASVIDSGIDHNAIMLGIQASNNYAYSRIVGYVSDTSIKFTVGYRLSASGSSTNACIPLEILGINELAHQTVGERYDTLPFQNLAANVIPSFTTKGKAKAIWMHYGVTTSANKYFITNVNPTTGEIDNNHLYKYLSNGTINDLGNTAYFTVTDNSVAYSSGLSSSALQIALNYTYE